MRILASLLCLMVTLCAAFGQVSVEIVLEQEQFLPAETVLVAVRIANRSGQTLLLGTAPDWLTFSVEAADGMVVPKLDEVPVSGEFVLESSKVATRRINLTPYFSLTKPGRYFVTATIRIPQWGTEFSSRPKPFDIIQGNKLWEQEVGVPPPAGSLTNTPEVRKYALQQANYLKQLKLYVRLTDSAESRILALFPLGPIVSFGRPEVQVDQQSNLHVLFQSKARSFTYCVVNPDGRLILRQTYDYVNSRPRLAVDTQGKISVAGGVRRIAADDLPAQSPTTITNAVKSAF